MPDVAPPAPDVGTPMQPPSVTPKKALYVSSPDPLAGVDKALADRLRARNYDVEVVADMNTTTASANGKALIVISASVDSPPVGTKFDQVPVPVLLFEANLYDDMRFVAPTQGQTRFFGSLNNQTQIRIDAPNHPLAAGLTGTVTVYTAPASLTTGVVPPGAIKIAYATEMGDPAVLFAFDKGQAMDRGTAPARRVGFFVRENPNDILTDDAQKLFDAATDWLTAPP